jgi:hypothetical protein
MIFSGGTAVMVEMEHTGCEPGVRAEIDFGSQLFIVIFLMSVVPDTPPFSRSKEMRISCVRLEKVHTM